MPGPAADNNHADNHGAGVGVAGGHCGEAKADHAILIFKSKRGVFAEHSDDYKNRPKKSRETEEIFVNLSRLTA